MESKITIFQNNCLVVWGLNGHKDNKNSLEVTWALILQLQSAMTFECQLKWVH